MTRQAGRLIATVVALSILVAQCGKADRIPYRYPLVKGPQALLKVSPTTSTALYGADSGKWVSVPMRAGEVLYSLGDNQNYFFRNDASLPDSLDFTMLDSTLVMLNGKPYALSIENDLPITALQSMSATDMQQLRSLRIVGNIPQPFMPWLDSLSRVNPDIDLHIQSDSTARSLALLSWIADHFRPRFMVLEIPLTALDTLQRFQSLESLYLQLADDSAVVRPVILPEMDSLRQLTIDHDGDSARDWSAFFSRNPQLASISLSNPGPGILRAAEQLHKLREVYLLGDDSLRNLPDAETWKECRVLSIQNPLAQAFPLEQILAFDHLKELGLPASLSQDQFNTILSANKHLLSLSVFAQDTLVAQDYAILHKLKDLRVLQITGKNGSVEALKPLKRLEFLSLPESFFKDSTAVASLQKALPDTRITPNGGFCMGSGWILLFWPLTLLSMLAWKWLRPAIADR